MDKVLRLVALLTGVALILTGCANGEPEASDGRPYNEADVQFATEMIQHHAGAVQMVNLTLGRDLDPEMKVLAEEIRETQSREIETMTDWLEDWDKPIPETVIDHANAHGDGTTTGSHVPGAVSEAVLGALRDARGEAFETRWLEAMIEHHRGAMEMARAQQDDGSFRPAVKLAERIENTQQREIAGMEDLLRS